MDGTYRRRGAVLRFLQALGLVLPGAILGGLGELAVSRLLAGFLYSVGAADPLTYWAVSVLLARVAALANVLPARRAVNIDPIHSLR